jgi:hypothetical protein
VYRAECVLSARNCGRCSSCRPCPVPEPRPLASEMPITTADGDITDTAPSHDVVPSYLKLLAKDVNDVTRQLETAAMELRASGPHNPDMLFVSSRIFLPWNMISRITDSFHQIDSEEALKACMEGWKYWDDYGSALWHVVAALRSDVREKLETRHNEKLAKQREAREKKRDDEVRAYNATHGLTNVKHVTLVLPQNESNRVPSLPSSAADTSSTISTLKIRDIGTYHLPALQSGIESNFFYATKDAPQKRKRHILQPHNAHSPPKRPRRNQPLQSVSCPSVVLPMLQDLMILTDPAVAEHTLFLGS